MMLNEMNEKNSVNINNVDIDCIFKKNNHIISKVNIQLLAGASIPLALFS